MCPYPPCQTRNDIGTSLLTKPGAMMRSFFVVAALLSLSAGTTYASASCDRGSSNADVLAIRGKTAQAQDMNRMINGEVDASSPAFGRSIDTRVQATIAEMLAGFKKRCQPGDVISVPSAYASVVKQVCDFNKSVVKQGDTTMCIMRQVSP